MTQNELMFIAVAQPEVASALSVLAQHIEKVAANNASAFNESVPAAQVQPMSNTANGVQVYGQADPSQTAQGTTSAAQAAADQMPQAPAGTVDVSNINDPIALAQQFMAPVFDAAMQGDPNAQAAIGIAAAQIFRHASDANAADQAAADQMAAESGLAPTGNGGAMPLDPQQQAQAQAFADQQAQAGIAPGGAPADQNAQVQQTQAPAQPQTQGAGAAAPTQTPEQAVADQIVPEVAAKPKKKEEKGEKKPESKEKK